jgi:hypothetical protein
MVTRELTHSGETQRFTVTRSARGWEIREERDSRVVKKATYSDWHRVERALQVFDLQSRPAPDGDA